jgi:hypothetical protein
MTPLTTRAVAGSGASFDAVGVLVLDGMRPDGVLPFAAGAGTSPVVTDDGWPGPWLGRAVTSQLGGTTGAALYFAKNTIIIPHLLRKIQYLRYTRYAPGIRGDGFIEGI